ncbi:MAG: ABC transporter substrate-binding protein [Terrimicrobiaceae bacterium]|nr:ABC transporter substrate-binding protein [Terrimicrobiaceae bacterium]
MMRRVLESARDFFPLIVVGAALAWASVSIWQHRVHENPPGTIVIRIGHWQLEAGVREAIEAVARDYEKLHPNVRIVQDAIPDQVFAQWINTQLVGGTAPDLVEAGGLMAPPLWLNLQRRYLVPLTRYYARPNPYNAGTDLEGVPLTQTLKGGNAVVPELQENMEISLSRVSVRLFYNRDLLRRVTGLETPPSDLGGFVEMCRKIQAAGVIPVVGSSYHFGMWNQLFDAVTYPAWRRGDFNRDGYVGSDETFAAFQLGHLDMNFPAYRAKFDLIGELSPYFQPGFAGLTREEGVLLFAQQRAVFMSTGLWEALGLMELAKGKFEIGVMKFPEPTANDERFGRYLEGPIYEDPRIVFGFGVTKTSRHPEVAIDFLLFMASQRENERLNRIIGWIPNTVGADPDPTLAAFEPNLRGVYPAQDFTISGDTTIRWKQLFDLFSVGQISYDDLAKDFGAFFRERGAVGLRLQHESWQRGLVQREQLRAGLLGRSLAADGATATLLRDRFVSLLPVHEVIDHAFLIDLAAGRLPSPSTSDKHSPAVRDAVRRALQP